MEVEYWSTLTTRGRRDVAGEEEVIVTEVEKGVVLLCRFLADETNPQSVGNTFLLSLPHQ